MALIRILSILFISALSGFAHPGVGIVKDSKGNIYYTNLQEVWKITKGKKTLLVPNVHTHELYIDQKDNLYGEGGFYDDKNKKFYHYLWVYRPNGKLDTVVGMKEQYLQQDFALARDKAGNEFYIKRFLRPHTDTNNIYRKTPGGKETIYASGYFKNVNWLHPQDDGSLLYASNNAIYRVDTLGNIKLIKSQVGNAKPSFKFSGNSITIWGIWQDNEKNVYAAVFSEQAVKKIATDGSMTEVHKSDKDWAPLHGVFDADNRLWVLETSDKNEVRAILATGTSTGMKERRWNRLPYFMTGGIALGIVFIIFFRKLASH